MFYGISQWHAQSNARLEPNKAGSCDRHQHVGAVCSRCRGTADASNLKADGEVAEMLALEGSDLLEVLGCRPQQEGCQGPENLSPGEILVKKSLRSADILMPKFCNSIVHLSIPEMHFTIAITQDGSIVNNTLPSELHN